MNPPTLRAEMRYHRTNKNNKPNPNPSLERPHRRKQLPGSSKLNLRIILSPRFSESVTLQFESSSCPNQSSNPLSKITQTVNPSLRIPSAKLHNLDFQCFTIFVEFTEKCNIGQRSESISGVDMWKGKRNFIWRHTIHPWLFEFPRSSIVLCVI